MSESPAASGQARVTARTTAPGTPNRRPKPTSPDDHSATVLLSGGLRAVDGLAKDTPPTSLVPPSSRLYHPMARLGLLILTVAVVGGAVLIGGSIALSQVMDPTTASLLAYVAALAIAYPLHAVIVERRRPPIELAPRRIGGLFVGLAMGVVVFSVIVAILAILGMFRVQGLNLGYAWVTPVILVGVNAGITEEIIFRGILFRYVEQGLGTWLAIAISGLAFGAVHITNPNASVVAGIAIAIEAGVLLGLLYAVSRSLWLCIGFHAAWNLTQGPLWGIPVSGATSGGFLNSTLSGPDIVTGGAFGAEAGIVAVVVCLGVSAWLFILLRKQDGVVAPAWVRRNRMRADSATASRVQPA